MAQKRYRFPKGTTKISPKEIEHALCNYLVVEIPGTVSKVEVRAENGNRPFVAEQLILHEGTLELRFGFASKAIRYNVPKSVRTISCPGGYGSNDSVGFMAPRVLCLNADFISAESLQGVEYLQTHSSSYVGYSHCSNLKHFVYLGTTINQKHGQFDYLTPGCVIHVENEKMAKSVLKRTNILENYVVVDAQEWKDFPADKLALTTEEYDPESRMLPLQKEMRAEELRKRKEKEEQAAVQHREREKAKMINKITDMAAKPAFDAAGLEYDIRSVKDKTHEGADMLEITLPMVKKIVRSQNYTHTTHKFKCSFIMSPDVVTDVIDSVVSRAKQLSDFLAANKEFTDKHEITYDFKHDASCAFLTAAVVPQCGISLPITDGRIVAKLFQESCREDANAIITFAEQLNRQLQETKNGLENVEVEF